MKIFKIGKKRFEENIPSLVDKKSDGELAREAKTQEILLAREQNVHNELIYDGLDTKPTLKIESIDEKLNRYEKEGVEYFDSLFSKNKNDITSIIKDSSSYYIVTSPNYFISSLYPSTYRGKDCWLDEAMDYLHDYESYLDFLFVKGIVDVDVFQSFFASYYTNMEAIIKALIIKKDLRLEKYSSTFKISDAEYGNMLYFPVDLFRKGANLDFLLKQ